MRMSEKEFLQQLLDGKMFTQEQVAECLGVDQSLISKWKTGEREMTVNQFEQVCNLFGYSLADYSCGICFRPIKIAFSAKCLTKEDVVAIGKINKILANLNYMEMLANNETRS